jgi:hypothetical protein
MGMMLNNRAALSSPPALGPSSGTVLTGLPLPTDTYSYQVRQAQAGGDQVLDEYGRPKFAGAVDLKTDKGVEKRVAPEEDETGDPVVRSPRPTLPGRGGIDPLSYPIRRIEPYSKDKPKRRNI